MTTWRLESIWTLTLSTTISTSPSSMAGLSHGPRVRRPAHPSTDLDRDLGHQRSHQEPADVGEECHPAAGLDHAQRCQAVEQLEHEPEAEHDDRRDIDQLVEEAEKDQRRHPGTREEHEVDTERRRDRPRGADRRDGGCRVDGDLCHDDARATEKIEAKEPGPAEAILDVVAEDPQVEHV